MESDGALLVQWRGGDDDAGKQLVRRYYRDIDRFFANKVSVDGPDLVQETFLGCLNAPERLRDSDGFRKYLFGIAYNVLKKYIARKKRDGKIADGQRLTMQELDPNPRSFIIHHEEMHLLLAALRSIPVELQCILELFYWEELKVREIGEIIGIPKGTAQSRLHRAREQLEKALKRLAKSPEVLASTRSNLDRWAHLCRLEMNRTARRPDDPPEEPEDEEE